MARCVVAHGDFTYWLVQRLKKKKKKKKNLYSLQYLTYVCVYARALVCVFNYFVDRAPVYLWMPLVYLDNKQVLNADVILSTGLLLVAPLFTSFTATGKLQICIHFPMSVIVSQYLTDSQRRRSYQGETQVLRSRAAV